MDGWTNEGWKNELEEAAWPSGLGHWWCNPEVPVQVLHPATGGIYFSVVLGHAL